MTHLSIYIDFTTVNPLKPDGFYVYQLLSMSLCILFSWDCMIILGVNSDYFLKRH